MNMNAKLFPPARTARGSLIVEVYAGASLERLVTLTVRGADVLRSLGTGRYVRGAEVAAARKLEALGLVTITDDGIGPRYCGRVDGERWTALPTDLGALVRTAIP